jgi:tRNA G10  N-methylase Trm11
LFGSDVSLKAVEDTRKNISWTKELYSLKDFRLKLQVKNAIYLSKFIKADYVDAIITEPYLGPQRGRIEFNAIIRELERLYSDAIKEFVKVLKPGSRVIMIWPMFYGQKPITPVLTGLKIVEMIPNNLKNSPFIKQTSRQTIVYGRPGQKVFREIVTLEKI